MNRYHIEVISNSVRTRRAVDADGISWSESGLYEFWKRNDNGKTIAVAYYPVSKTIIDNIEFNIEEKNEQ
jgi:hypothetical protein